MGFGTRKRTPWPERDLENIHRRLRMQVLRVLSGGDLMSPAMIWSKMRFGPIGAISFINKMASEGLIAKPMPSACIGKGGGWQITDAGRAYLVQQQGKE